MDLLFDLSFYFMGAMLTLPFVVLAGFLTRILKVNWKEGFMLLPAGLIGIVVADLWFIGEQGCNPIYAGFCEGFAIVGWIFYLPALVVLPALNFGALGMIIPRTLRYWRR